MATDSAMLAFEDFRREVGASEYSVRLALAALGFTPVPDEADRRTRLYRREWISPVKGWLKNRGGL